MSVAIATRRNSEIDEMPTGATAIVVGSRAHGRRDRRERSCR